MLAAALIFGLAAACQVIAPLLRVPALVLLLPVGFCLGLVAPQLRADVILGSAFPAVVDLVVALILFKGGLELGNISLKGTDRKVVLRLLWIGSSITWLGGTLTAHYLLGLSWQLAILLGAILIVSGPTVVTPILNFAQPQSRIRGILTWEGTTLDPWGAILAVVVFQVIQAGSSESPLAAVGTFVGSLAVAFVAAAVGVFLAVIGARYARGNPLIATQVLIGAVLAAAGVANYFADGSGLLAALLMGLATQRVAHRLNEQLTFTLPFFDTVATTGIGVLFVSIAALVPSSTFISVALPALAVAVILILVVRPAVAAVCTFRTDLTRSQRIFIGWMDPRGIVAAATASSLGASLVAAKVPGADVLLPAAFVIITVTVFVYGLTAVPVAKLLGVREAAPANGQAPSKPGV